MGIRVRLAAAGMLGVVVAGSIGASVGQAGTTTCRVRNVTQDTAGRSFRTMTAAAHDGDRLTVRGVCPSRGVLIRADLTIRGVGEYRAVLKGHGDRVLRVPADTVVVLRRLKLTGGSSPAGGGIMNRGHLTLVDTIVQRSFGTAGGGIVTYGTLRLTDSVVRGNQAWYAGGIHVAGGTATLRRSRVVANTALDQGAGGGIRNEGTLTVVGSIIARNRVDFGGGGGIDNGGVLKLIDSTVRANAARTFSSDFGGGGGIQNSGSLTLVRSTVIGNSIGTEPGGGGGVFNSSGSGTVTLDQTSAVTDNTPDDCVGTTAC